MLNLELEFSYQRLCWLPEISWLPEICWLPEIRPPMVSIDTIRPRSNKAKTVEFDRSTAI